MMRTILASMLLLSSTSFAAESGWIEQIIESLHPYNNLSQQVWNINSLYANKVTLSFERLALAKGDSLILANSSGDVLAQYDGPLDLSNFETTELKAGAITI